MPELPQEVLSELVPFLGKRDFGTVSALSHLWHDALMLRSLWATFDVSGDPYEIQDATIAGFLAAAPAAPRELNLRGCLKLSDAGIESVADLCAESLESLRIDGTLSFRQALLTDDGVAVLARCAALRKLEVRRTLRVSDVGLGAVISGTSLLEHLDLGGNLRLNGDVLPLVRRLRHLRHLSLAGCRVVSNESLLQFFSEEQGGEPALSDSDGEEGDGPESVPVPALEHLDLSGMLNLDTLVVMAAARAVGPSLRHLSLAGCRRVDDIACGPLATRCQQLEVLVANGMSRLTEAGLRTLLEGVGHGLRVLAVSRCKALTPAAADIIALSCPNLRQLDARDIKTGDRGVQALAAALTEVETLNISCRPANRELTDVAATAIAGGFPALRVLDLGGNFATPAGVDLLLRKPGLERLDLRASKAAGAIDALVAAAPALDLQTLAVSAANWAGPASADAHGLVVEVESD